MSFSIRPSYSAALPCALGRWSDVVWRADIEVPDPVPFEKDGADATCNRDSAQTFWHMLLAIERMFAEFRSRFIGKYNPVHFFWGRLDLAVTRFSVHRAPEARGADRITREAYSQEPSSVGFRPGSGNIQHPTFYSYAPPEPPGFRHAAVVPGNGSLRYPTRRVLPYA
jgi:hypothetical protein